MKILTVRGKELCRTPSEFGMPDSACDVLKLDVGTGP